MSLLDSLLNNYFIGLLVVIVVVIVIANLITSILKKGGEVAVEGTVSASKKLFSGLKYIFVTIYEIIVVILIVIKLIFIYFFSKRN